MNSPFSSFPEPLFQSEVNYDDIDMKISFYSHENKTHFRKKCFALSLILKVRVVGILKWRIRVLKGPFIFYGVGGAGGIWRSVI